MRILEQVKAIHQRANERAELIFRAVQSLEGTRCTFCGICESDLPDDKGSQMIRAEHGALICRECVMTAAQQLGFTLQDTSSTPQAQ